MMKALVKSRPEPGLWIESVPLPTAGPNEVLIKVAKAGICGTDRHIFNWDGWAQRNIHVPRTIRHEFVGEIVAIGPGVAGYRVGDRVTAEGHIVCGVCRNCRAGKRHLCAHAVGTGGGRDGAFAQYVAMSAFNLWPIHPDIPSDVAAILDPFGNAVHCALSFNVVAKDVLITGAGPIGLMAVAVCRFIGARHIVVTDANNYLGLANHPEIIEAAIGALHNHGFGMASVRFICGLQDLHKELEQAIAAFLGTEDAILYSSCFDANTGLFETLLGEEDAVISDALNHASIIDGIRLCKAARLRFAHGDMGDLEYQLQNAAYFRCSLQEKGFSIRPGEHAIIPIMLHEAGLAQQMAVALLDEGIYVIGFSYPVVPQGEARIRVQISAAHARVHLDRAIEAFSRVGRQLGVIR